MTRRIAGTAIELTRDFIDSQSRRKSNIEALLKCVNPTLATLVLLVPGTAQKQTIRFSNLLYHIFVSRPIMLSISFSRVDPKIVLSSLPNLIRKEFNHVSRKDGQISLSISCNNEKSCSTSCTCFRMMNKTLLDGRMVEVKILLKLMRQIGITAQPKTEAE